VLRAIVSDFVRAIDEQWKRAGNDAAEALGNPHCVLSVPALVEVQVSAENEGGIPVRLPRLN
jgi:hypothetical protein